MRVRSGVMVGGFLGVALGTVGLLTVQASQVPLRGRAGAAQRQAAAAEALPAGSGSGARVVYSLGRHRVWLVDAQGRVGRTYTVVSGAVAPPLGTHRVFARQAAGRDGTGTRVAHMVLFASAGEANVGFCGPAEDDAKAPAPDPRRLGPAIREPREDADALWQRATVGSFVTVVH